MIRNCYVSKLRSYNIAIRFLGQALLQILALYEVIVPQIHTFQPIM